jgi:predicted transcriptional regulator
VTGGPQRLNTVGDLVLTDPEAMRALADPMRLRLFDLVRRDGPVTATVLGGHTDQDPAPVEDHLRALRSIGLVENRAGDDGEVRWTAAAEGIYFEVPDDPEGHAAARRLSKVMTVMAADLPAAWARDEEPGLDLEWARAAGVFNARIELTSDELRGLQEGLERLLTPFTTRPAEASPAGAAPVRILGFFMPEPPTGGETAGAGARPAPSPGP